MPIQIVGDDGTLLDPMTARLALMMEGVQRGEMDPQYVIGAAAPIALQLSRSPLGGTPAAQRALGAYQAMTQNQAYQASRDAFRNASPAAVAAAAAAGAASAGQPRVVESSYGPIREVVQGLDSGPVLIVAGGSFPITFNASMEFRPSRLMVGPSVAPFWGIQDLKVGPDSLFLNTGTVPAENFLPDSVGASALKRKTARAGTPIAVIVENLDGVAHRFRGALYGDGVDAGSC